MPMEKAVRNSVTTWSLPPITFLAKAGNWARKVAPRSQNQEIPSIDRKMPRRAATWRTIRQLSETMLKPILRSGTAEGARGM